MYKIVFDSDGLLKTLKGGFLREIAETYECHLPEEVYREAVVAARPVHAEEAASIEGLVSEGKLVRKRRARSTAADRLLLVSAALGEGERGALRLFYQEGADFLVTDDRAFLNVLIRHRVPFLTPAGCLVRLRERNILSRHAASTAAERLQPYIRQDVYRELRERLEELP